MNVESLGFNQQVSAVIRYQVKPEATREALKRYPLFNLVASCPTHLMLEKSWFDLDKDVRFAELSRRLVTESTEIQACMKGLSSDDIVDQQVLDGMTARKIQAILRTKAAGRFAVEFPKDVSRDQAEIIIEKNIPFLKLTQHLKALAADLEQNKAGALIRVEISHTPLIS